jgi:hypothetical protein
MIQTSCASCSSWWEDLTTKGHEGLEDNIALGEAQRTPRKTKTFFAVLASWREKMTPKYGSREDAKAAKANLKPKFEIRNSKQFQINKITRFQTAFRHFGILFVSDFDIRISDFVLVMVSWRDKRCLSRSVEHLRGMII